jgi:S1-C subfamily serine protease
MEEIQIKTLRDGQREKMQKTKDFFQNKTINRMPEQEMSKSKGFIKKLIKTALLLFLVFTIGGIGGVYIDRIFIPNILIKYPELNQYDLLKKVNERTTIVRETQEIKISQEEGISGAIEKVQPTVIEIFLQNSAKDFEKVGSGIILTSDGYILTSLNNIREKETATSEESKTIATTKSKIEVELKNEKRYETEIISESSKYNLAILKISENNLPVIPYANSQDLKLGEKLIIIDSAVVTDIISKFIEDYIAEGSTDSAFQNRIKIVQNLETTFAGSAVINIKGELVGMAQGENLIIPLSEIENFINDSIED